MLFKSIALITVFDAIIKMMGFLIIPLYLVWMPKSEYGEFGYIQIALGMLPAIITLGLYVPQIKESSSSKDKKNCVNIIFSTTLIIITLVSVSLTVILALSDLYLSILSSVFLIKDNIEIKWMILSILIIFYSINLIIYSHALHYQQPLKIVKYNSLKFIFINAFGLLLLHLGLGYSDTVLERLVGLVIAEVLLCFITFYWLARHNWIWKIEINYLKNALKTSLPLIPGSIAALISAMSDRFFLGKHFDSGYVAEYNLALQILMPLQMVVAGAQTIWAPHIFAEKADDNAKIKSYKFFLQLLILFLLLIPALMLLTFMAKQYNVIPSTYNDTLLLIPSLSIGVICLVLLNIPFNLFIRSGKTSGIAYISIFGAVLTVIGCAFIIPRYGYFGGAVVNGVVNITMLAIAWWYVSKLNVRD